MKSIFLFSMGSLVLLMTACDEEKQTTAHNRIVFDSGGLQVISSSVNKNLETMSLLYGNDKAHQSAMNSTNMHAAGEAFKFVTWQYHDNPFFYGSKINGELLSVESINMNEHGIVEYEIEVGSPLPVNGIRLNQQERIKYILEYKPSLLP